MRKIRSLEIIDCPLYNCITTKFCAFYCEWYRGTHDTTKEIQCGYKEDDKK